MVSGSWQGFLGWDEVMGRESLEGYGGFSGVAGWWPREGKGKGRGVRVVGLREAWP